jgi:hypothetical protein
MPPKSTTPLTVRRDCLHCAQPFEVQIRFVKRGDGRYCSRQCSAQAKRSAYLKGEYRACLHCKNTFYVRRAALKRGDGVYCSLVCYRDHRYPQVQRICGHCDTPFRVSPSRIARGDGKYCSAQCVRSRRTGEYRACRICGFIFYILPKRAQETGGSHRSCSKACADKAKRNDLRHDRRSWQYREWRNTVLARDGHTCQRCGTTKKLHAHHLKLWSRFPKLRFDPDNGLTLCDRCHYDWHKEDGTLFAVFQEPA